MSRYGLDVWRIGVLGLLLTGAAGVPWEAARADTAEREATAKAAGHLLWRATRPAPGRGQSEVRDSLLRSLRALEDPAVRPVFERLVGSRDVGLRMHGVMGLAELAEPREIDLSWLEGFERAEQRWEVIGAALDEGLLPREKAEQLLAWDGLDDGVKCLIAVQLVAEGWRGDVGFVRRAMEEESAGQRGLAALLLVAMEDDSGLPALDWLATRPVRERALVEVMLANTVRRHWLKGAGPWVLGLAEKRGVEDAAGPAALGAAMWLKMEGSGALWEQWWAAAVEAEDKLRMIELGMLALRTLPGTPLGVFEAMNSERHRVGGLVGLLGEAGRAAKVRFHGKRLDEEVQPLIAALRAIITDGRPVALSWAVEYAASVGDSTREGVLGWAVDRVEEGRPEQIEPRSALALQAARLWLAADRDAAVAGLASVLGRYKTDGVIDDGVAAMRRAVLLACIAEGVSADGAQMILDTLPTGLLRTEADLVLALRATHGMALEEGDVERLGSLVQGAGRVGDSLRTQLAWRWLKEAGLIDEALAAVLPTVQ
ncbi:MAG: hypothetical protein AAF797_05490 [Planctomycetota bacterium]